MSDETPVDATENRRILRSLWRPHPGQRAVMDSDARFRIVACGRRWGKSEMCAHLALEYALENRDAVVWWVGPTFDDSNDFGFENIKPLASPDVLADRPKLTKPREIRFTNSSVISFRSAEREDSLRGAGVDFLIIDESASVPERAWVEELRPTLSDTEGDMIAIGTPKGRNWFYNWFTRGQSVDHSDVASWRAPTYQNPHVPDSEVDAARGDMPERVFHQEYLAEFVDDTGGVFPGLREHAVERYDLPVSPVEDQVYAIGVDFARLEDYTAIVVLDSDGRLVSLTRVNETTWHRIQSQVETLADRYTPSIVAVDATRDNKIVGDLAENDIPVRPVSFSASKKQTLIDNLATRLESGEITISSEASVLVNELEMFEYEVLPSRNVRYGAPSGFHDDTVDALALAADQLDAVQAQAACHRRADEDRGSGITFI